MFDADDRKEGSGDRSLLALAREARRPAARGGSLLGIGGEAPEDTDRTDAALRHRMARSRREAVQSPVMAALSQRHEPAPEARTERPEPRRWRIAEALRRRFASRGEPAPAAADEQPRAPEARRHVHDLHPVEERPLPENASPSAAAAAPAESPGAPAPPSGSRDDFRRGDAEWRPLIDPMMVVDGVVRSKWIIAAAALAGAVIGVAVALATPHRYAAGAELLVDPRDIRLVDTGTAPTALSNEATLAIIENQVQFITSGSVLNQVVDELNLTADPEFNGEAGGLTLNPLALVRGLISGRGSDDPGSLRGITVDNLYRSLGVARTERTFVIWIGATTRSADKSAMIANSVTDVFMRSYGALQASTLGRATDELTGRLDELRAVVELAERAVEAFKAENDIIDAQGRLITDDEILRLNEQLSVARARSTELNARAQSARSVDIDAVIEGVLPEQVASGVLAELRTQFSSLSQEADRLAVRLGPRHPERQAIEAQLAGARDQIAAELRRVVASIQVELTRAVQLERDLSGQLARLKVRQGELSSELVTLRELEREAAAKRTVYENFLLRARQSGEQQGLNTANINVISEAYPPLRPVGPSRAVISTGGLVLGLLAGIGFGGARGAYASLSANAAAGAPRRRSLEPRPGTDGPSGDATVDDVEDRRPEGPRTEENPTVSHHFASPFPPHWQDPAAAAYAGPPDHGFPGHAPQPFQPVNGGYGAPWPGQPDPAARYGYAQPAPGYPSWADWNARHHAPPAYYPAPPVQPQAWAPHPGAYPQPHRSSPQSYYPVPAPIHEPGPSYPPAHPQAYSYAPPQASQALVEMRARERSAEAASEAESRDRSQIEEIRESLREFREAVRELTESRKKRRFY